MANKRLSDKQVKYVRAAVPLKKEDKIEEKLAPLAVGRVVLAASPTNVAIEGIAAGDIAIVSLVSDDTGAPVGLILAECEAGNLKITPAGVTNNDAVLSFVIFRA